jgi:toxin ParE1/3/4
MKPHMVIFSLRAEQQLGHLYGYIADRDGEERAENYTNKIIDFCQGLATFPERGTRRDDVRPGLRVVGYAKRVTIAFAIKNDRVIIHGVFYGGQDYESIIGEEEP